MIHIREKWRFLFLYLLCFIFLFVVDMTAIQLFFKKPYDIMLRKINASKSFTPRLIPVILFYILLTIGFMIFVYPKIWGARENGLLYGFLFGIIIYGFYSLTNYALIDKWDLNIVIMDTLWGGIYLALAAVFIQFIDRKI